MTGFTFVLIALLGVPFAVLGLVLTFDPRWSRSALMQAAEAHFATLLARPNFALSLEVQEISAPLSWKTNAIHPRLRTK